MEEKKLDEYSREDVVERPKNETREGVVVDVEMTTAKAIFGDNLLPKQYPDRRMINVTYEIAELGLRGSKALTFFPPGSVPSNSGLGRFLKRYGSLKPGTLVKVDFDGEGKYNLLV
jgi:hypothetical protein